MSDALKVTGLVKEYDGFRLNNVSFSVPKGSVMGLIGENGAGKSTTIKALLGLISRGGGTVRILGMDPDREERPVREQIGVVFEESCFHDNLTAPEISRIMGKIYRNWDDVYFLKLCRGFSLPAGRTVKELSRGMKMKLCIAAALAHHPKLLILDEATSGLDPVVRDEILDLFREFIQDEEHAVLLSSHITSDLDKIADYITFLHEGEVVFSRPKDEMLDGMGIAKCGQADFDKLDRTLLVRCRKNAFACEALVRDRAAFRARYPHITVDRASLEEIMLFYVRGQAPGK